MRVNLEKTLGQQEDTGQDIDRLVAKFNKLHGRAQINEESVAAELGTTRQETDALSDKEDERWQKQFKDLAEAEETEEEAMEDDDKNMPEPRRVLSTSVHPGGHPSTCPGRSWVDCSLDTTRLIAAQKGVSQVLANVRVGALG